MTDQGDVTVTSNGCCSQFYCVKTLMAAAGTSLFNVVPDRLFPPEHW